MRTALRAVGAGSCRAPATGGLGLAATPADPWSRALAGSADPSAAEAPEGVVLGLAVDPTRPSGPAANASTDDDQAGQQPTREEHGDSRGRSLTEVAGIVCRGPGGNACRARVHSRVEPSRGTRRRTPTWRRMRPSLIWSNSKPIRGSGHRARRDPSTNRRQISVDPCQNRGVVAFGLRELSLLGISGGRPSGDSASADDAG